MNSRERYIAMVEGKTYDRVPKDGLMCPETLSKLRHTLGCNDNESVMNYLGIDARYLDPAYIGPVEAADSDGEFVDMWGVRRRRFQTSCGYEWAEINQPLAQAQGIADIDAFNWPDPDTFDFESWEADLDGAADCARLCGTFNVLSNCQFLRGMEQFMLDVCLDPDFTDHLIRRITDFNLAYLRNLITAGRGRIDFIKLYEDLGTQQTLLMSIDMIRRYFAGPWSEIVSLAHANGIRVMFHSCGAIRDAIPVLLELNIDMLDPIQTSASGMNPGDLAAHYAGRVCFHGGVDTQHTLVDGSPEDVRQEVAQLLEVFTGNSGRYILCPSQLIQSDVPVENVLALYSAV